MNEPYSLIVRDIENIPTLRLEAANLPGSAPVGIVLHGLTRTKESMLPTLFALARKGIRAIGLDARLHGARSGADTLEGALQTAYVQTMDEIIFGTAADISIVLDHLGAERAAVHGVSLGGYVAFCALLDEPRLAAAAVALGSPDLAGPLRDYGVGPGHPLYDWVSSRSPLELAAASYPPRPLLMLHGDSDSTVSVSGVEALERRLRPYYARYPERLELILYPGLDHVYTDDMMTRSVEWIARFAA